VSEPVKYAVNPLAPFPKRWSDKIGNIIVMCEPVKGYVMCRRPGAVPFVLSVAQILNAEKHPYHGPFTMIPPAHHQPNEKTEASQS
jgi:hypothetical protein